MTHTDESAFAPRNDGTPAIDVSGVPLNHVAIDMTKKESPVSEPEAPAAPAEAIPEAKSATTEEAPSAPVQENVTVPTVEIIGIRFKSNGKVYYFDPRGIAGKKGQYAIVETARGQEYGEIALENTRVPESEIVPPIRPMIRIATEADKQHFEENKQKEKEAFSICLTKIAAHNLDMKLVEAQYTFDNSKLLFYFTSAGRVDFRDLVKDLASVFRTRIELRQIGIRDEAKLIGGLGSCGRSLCCSGFLTDFGQVSIKMAKEQNLSLNSTKISGTCGRLMCCLRYEYETYLEEARLTPPVDSKVRTPDGIGTVVEIAPMLASVKVRLASDPEGTPRTYHRDTVTVCDGSEPAPTPISDEDTLAEKLSAFSEFEETTAREIPTRRVPSSERSARRNTEGFTPLRREGGQEDKRYSPRSGNGERRPRPDGARRDFEDNRSRTQQRSKNAPPPRKRNGNKTQHRGNKDGGNT